MKIKNLKTILVDEVYNGENKVIVSWVEQEVTSYPNNTVEFVSRVVVEHHKRLELVCIKNGKSCTMYIDESDAKFISDFIRKEIFGEEEDETE